MRVDGRELHQLRPCSIETDYLRHALASVLISTGDTRVICTASVESKTPPWLQNGGWVTAEYSMLPGSTGTRARRDPGGRGKEIQRLIGRSLRAGIDRTRLVGPEGGLSIICDCDVIDADGGTRTASISGAFVALSLAIRRLKARGALDHNPIIAPVAAVSVGIVESEGAAVPMLDLNYPEDSRAEVDLNVVASGVDELIEVQGTAEGSPFSRTQLNQLLDLAMHGIKTIRAEQDRALAEATE